jgi:RNA polymerase sigma factor (sigma-70 family)
VTPERKRAIAEFLEEERPTLTRFVRSLIGDAPDREAEDVLQDVAVSMIESADISAPIGDLGAYIYGSIRNRVVDTFRRRRLSVSLDEDAGDSLTLKDLLPGSRYDASGAADKREMFAHLREAMESLKPEERATIVATEFDGMSFREVSESIGLQVGTLLSHKSRGLEKIRKFIKRHYGR